MKAKGDGVKIKIETKEAWELKSDFSGVWGSYIILTVTGQSDSGKTYHDVIIRKGRLGSKKLRKIQRKMVENFIAGIKFLEQLKPCTFGIYKGYRYYKKINGDIVLWK